MNPPTVLIVRQTLAFVAGGGSDDTARWCGEVEKMMERTPPREWWTCPVCEEVVCDSGCPLEAVRAEASA